MKDYLLSLLSISMCGAIGSCILFPVGDFKKYINIIVSLIIIVILANPASNLVKEISELSSHSFSDIAISQLSPENIYYARWKETLARISIENAEDIISDTVSERYMLSQDCFKIDAYVSESDGVFSLDEIVITLMGAGLMKNPRVIESEMSEYFSCKCTVY